MRWHSLPPGMQAAAGWSLALQWGQGHLDAAMIGFAWRQFSYHTCDAASSVKPCSDVVPASLFCIAALAAVNGSKRVANLRVVQLVLLAQLWFSLPSVVRGSAFMLVIAGSSFLNRMGIKKVWLA